MTPAPPPKREPKLVVYSYKMMDCPRKECNKQGKHEKGLKWNISHSHPEFIGPDGEIRDVVEVEWEEQEHREKRSGARRRRMNGKGRRVNRRAVIKALLPSIQSLRRESS